MKKFFLGILFLFLSFIFGAYCQGIRKVDCKGVNLVINSTILNYYQVQFDNFMESQNRSGKQTLM